MWLLVFWRFWGKLRFGFAYFQSDTSLITQFIFLCFRFMYAIGLVIDSVSVINLVLAVGLSVDYSAHIGHCFMVKGGPKKDQRVIESLADIGASVVNGALSTFLAVAVLLFSTS